MFTASIEYLPCDRMPLKLVSYNSRGFNDCKQQYLLGLLRDTDILFLQEHWLSDSQIPDLSSCRGGPVPDRLSAALISRKLAVARACDVDVCGTHHRCLLDTGCVPASLVPSAEVKPVDFKLYAADNTEISILGSLRLGFTVLGLLQDV